MSINSKLPKFLEAMIEVLSDERSVILTDKELRIAVNQRLNKKDRISESCFEFWKSPTLNKRSPENQNIDPEIVAEFRQTLEYARVEQKMNLVGNVIDASNKNQWGSTWILERKFKDLQIKQQLELPTQNIIQISASSDEHKTLINNILNGEIIDVTPEPKAIDGSLNNEQIMNHKNEHL
jgi:hypothetical protein